MIKINRFFEVFFSKFHLTLISIFILLCFAQIGAFAETKQIIPPPHATISDFDGDGKTDYGVFRPSDRTWYILRSSTNTYSAQTFGLEFDRIVPADYDGDGITDVAVYRNTDGNWYIYRSSDQAVQIVRFGLPNEDDPVPADYDGDGKTDLAVFRRTTGYWYLLRSRDGFAVAKWGTSTASQLIDVPFPGDFDGDGKSDLAIFRVRTSQWYILQSQSNNVRIENFSGSSVKSPVAADFDGDGKSDPGIIESSGANLNWNIKLDDNSYLIALFGQGGVNYDRPVLGDFDGDGKNDLAAWTPATGTYFVQLPNSSVTTRWGMRGDKPLTGIGVAQIIGGGDIIVSAY
jgi:spore coat protein A, manganese oxidase